LRPRHAAPSADAWAARLRAAEIPIVARVADQAVLLDARTLLPGDDDAIARAIEASIEPDSR
jgi:L-seryl-tRNA(Ser) seleniumtransferase